MTAATEESSFFIMRFPVAAPVRRMLVLSQIVGAEKAKDREILSMTFDHTWPRCGPFYWLFLCAFFASFTVKIPLLSEVFQENFGGF